MQIDWLTVTAQIVNFLVLVWLLQRFLYRPITDAMRRRETRIEERLAEAKAARAAAEENARQLERERQEIDADREDILARARAEADDLRTRLEAELREEMDDRRKTWQDHLAEEQDEIVAALRRQAAHQLLKITERVLADYADSDVAERVTATFIDRLQALDPEVRHRLAEAARQADATAVVETAAGIDTAARRQVTRAIHDSLDTDIEVAYREDAAMVLGLRLTIGDQTLEWSAVRYLGRLETALGEMLDASRHAVATATSGKPAAATAARRGPS